MKRSKIKEVAVVSFIATLVLMFCTPMVNAAEIQALNFEINSTENTFNVTGQLGGVGKIQTSYPGTRSVPQYYSTYVKTGEGTNEQVTSIQNNVAKTLASGLKVTHKFTLSNSNKTLTIDYKLENTKTTSVPYKMATISDIEFCDNDTAAVYKDGVNKLVITQDDSTASASYGTQMDIAMVTPASALWIGNYHTLQDTMYLNSTDTKFTKASHVDTGMSWSWVGTLAASGTTGSLVDKQVVINLQNAERHTLKIHNPDGSTKDYQEISGGGVELDDVPGYTTEWTTNADGTGTKYDQSSVIIMGNTDMELYAHNIPVQYQMSVSNDGTTSNPISYKITEPVELPTPTKDGYEFKGWKVVRTVGNWTANTIVKGKVENKYGNVQLVAVWGEKSEEETKNEVENVAENTESAEKDETPKTGTYNGIEMISAIGLISLAISIKLLKNK